MPPRTGARVVMNRQAVDTLVLDAADGIVKLAEAIIEEAKPNAPDAPPLIEGLPQQGGVGGWVDRKRVVPGRVRYPRTATASRAGVAGGAGNTGIVVLVGWGFPARFNEIGTVHQPARPFLTPAVMSKKGELAHFVPKPGRVRHHPPSGE